MGNFPLFPLVAFLTISLLAPAALSARTPTDRELVWAAEKRLQRDPGVSAHLVDVGAEDGIVTLSGSVSTALGAERATRVAESIRGVRSVVNTISVKAPDRPDEELRIDVAKALDRCPAPEVRTVDVAVSDGHVALDGAVNSWQERRLAEKKARSVRGVRAVENNLRIVYDAERTDADIRRDIQARLDWDVWVNSADIAVSARDGVVELSGAVASARQRRRAMADGWVKGVRKVAADDLIVDPARSGGSRKATPMPEVDDAAVAKAILQAFSLDPRVQREGIEVHVKDGVVTLNGSVRRASERRAIESAARATRGVWMVRNDVGVKPGMVTTRDPMVEDDPRIARRARTALRAHSDVHQHQISVEVTSGVAAVEGAVDSAFQKDIAGRIVSEVPGVVRVDNRLTVNGRETGRRSDPAIREDIRDELFWTPFVDGEDVTVTVSGGVATLTGVVDTLQARRMATKNARDGGARRVRNRLRVRIGPEYYQP
jgi:osmotically-inducible protein OsmY